MTDSNVTALPIDVDLDLDADDSDQSKPPFRFNLKGRVIAMTDPEDLDWKDLLLMQNPSELIRLAMPREDRDFFLEQSLSGRKLNTLMDRYYDHFGMAEKVEKAKRQQQLASLGH